MNIINFIKSFKNFAKWTALLIIIIFLFVLILNILNRREFRFKNRAKQSGFARNVSPLAREISQPSSIEKHVFSESGDERAFSASGDASNYKTNNKYLKDIFHFPDMKYKKFNRPFVSRLKIRNNKINYFGAGSISGGNLPDFIKKLKFKGFSNKKTSPPSLMFTGGKIALMKIGGKKYYVHSGEHVKGMFILKVGLSGISYSNMGKIKYLSF
ncbi:MAG: hypothetical protein ACYDDB_04475 [bacterium]